MSGSDGLGASDSPAARLAALPEGRRRLLYLRAVLRPLLTATLLVIGYFLLPLEHDDAEATLLLLIGGLVVIGGVCAWQIWQIMRAEFPLLQAVEALAAVVPAYLLAFAATYVLMSQADHATFSELLTHMAGLYFSLVVFATIGFGDIVPQTDAARAVVSVQIVGNLVLIGAGLRVVVAAIRHGQQRRQREHADS